MAEGESTPKTVLLVDDHALFRAGLRAVLEPEEDLRVVGEASDGRAAADMVRKLSPDVVVMDITMPGLNGIEATKEIVTAAPETKVLALSIHSGKRFITEMLRAGAAGYVLKESAPEELVEGIRAVLRGDGYLSPAVAGVVVSDYASIVPADGDASPEVAPGPILRTKLHPPRIMPDLLPRSHLLARLKKLRLKPLTLVSAAAGYGKSTLASLWLKAWDGPSAWLSLDEGDNDPRTFLMHLVAAIRTGFPDACAATEALLQAPQLPPVSVLSRYLLNDLDAIDQAFILVLDDYHRIKETAVHDLVAATLTHPPAGMHLMLLTRRDPPLPLSALRAHGQMSEITMADLRFTVEETLVFLRNALAVSVEEATATALQQRLEGWAAGIRLVSLSLRHQSDLDRMLKSLPGGFSSVVDYLVTEVLSQQPPEMTGFMVEASILNRFCAPLCDALRGPDVAAGAGEQLLAMLQRDNLFLVALDVGDWWYRYHHMFQHLLQGQLKRRCSEEEIATLHSRASRWFAENGLVDEAIDHAVRAGDLTGAAELVERNRQAMLNDDKWYVFEKWLSRLPESLVQQRPGLLLARSWVLYHHFQWSDLLSVLDDIECLLGPEPEAETLRGETCFFRGYVCYFQNQGERSLKYLEDALERIPATHGEARGQTAILFGLATQMQGCEQAALETLNDLLYHPESPQGVGRTRLLVTPVYIHIISGDLADAVTANQQLYAFAAANNYAYARVWSVYLDGLLHFYRNDLENAAGRFRAAIEEKYVMHTRAAVDCFSGLALACTAMSRTKEADAAVQGLVEYAESQSDTTYLGLADSCQARLEVLRGGPGPFVSKLVRDDPPAAENMVWWLEIPSVTYCRALVSEGSGVSLRQAQEKLRELLELNEGNHNTLQVIVIMALLGLTFKKQGRVDDALETVARAIGLAERGRIIRPFVELGDPMADLLRRLGRETTEADFIREVLSAFVEERHPVMEGEGAQAVRVDSTSASSLIEPLTSREEEVLELLAQRMRDKEIAAKLFVSNETVKTHLRNIYRKLDVANRREAVRRAVELRILTTI